MLDVLWLRRLDAVGCRVAIDAVVPADIHQFCLGEIGVARHLIACIAVGVLLEQHERLLSLVNKADIATWRQYVLIITEDGVDQTVGVPHALAGVASVVGVDRLDGVLFGVRQVNKDILGRIVHEVANVAGRHDYVDIVGQLVIENGRLLRGSTHVVSTEAVARLESSRLDVYSLDLLAKQVHTVQRRKLVGSRLEQFGNGCDKADGNDDHRLILGLTEELAVEAVAIHEIVVGHRALVQRVTLCVLEVTDAVVGDEAAGILHTVPLQSDRNLGVAIVGIEDVDQFGIFLAFTVNDNSLEIDLAFVDVMVKHHQSKQVIGRTAEVRVKNHLNGFAFLLGLVGCLLCQCLRLACSKHQCKRHSHHQFHAMMNGGFEIRFCHI